MPNIKKKFKVKINNRIMDKAIKRCGSQAELARQLEGRALVRCYPQKVNEWRLRGAIPPYWVRHIADILEIENKEIDPLLYG